MSDERLRDLQRRWEQSRAIEDEVLLLRQRVRIGDLPIQNLELAAHCGSRAAAQALGAPIGARELGSKEWCAEAVRLGGTAFLVLIALDASSLAVSAVLLEHEREHLIDLIEIGRSWVACPCREHARACSGASLLGRTTHPIANALLCLHDFTSIEGAKRMSEFSTLEATAAAVFSSVSLNVSQATPHLLEPIVRARVPLLLSPEAPLRLRAEVPSTRSLTGTEEGSSSAQQG